jgi:predicted Zn-dependent peptidase
VELHRRTLANGLRVVLCRRPTPRAAVCVHYGVGFRAEGPGQEGMAHLFEHLMFRGSENLPDGEFFTGLHALAGAANGTTHPDYTDYFQVLPAEALEQALFREADRMRAPRFTAAQLAGQLVEVGREIGELRGRPYGGFPWPLLPAAMYRSFANAHDGYGDPAALARVTVDDCAAFFDAHYAPGNAVLTVVAPAGPDEVWPLVERHFGPVPPRPVAAGVPPVERPVARTLTRPVAGVPRTAVAVGLPLPDPATALPAYAAHLVLARLTERLPGVPVGAACGFFGPLDVRHPDALVVTSVLPPGLSAPELTDRLTGWWTRLGDAGGDLRTAARGVARTLAAEHRRQHADVQQRCRALGRLELLFGRPEVVDELPAVLEALTPDLVADTAHALAAAPRTVLVLEPARSAREHAHAGPPAPTGTTAATAGPRRPLPPLTAAAPVGLDGALELTAPAGLRVVVVPDRRVDLVEVRLRVPLGPDGWGRTSDVAAVLRAVNARAAARAAAMSGTLTLTTDGQWADAAGYAPVRAADDLVRLLADVVTGEPPVPPAAVPPPRLTPPQRMDDALRRHWFGVPPSPPPSDLCRRVLSPRGAVLVVVGPVDPDRFAARLLAAFDGWTAPVGPDGPEGPDGSADTRSGLLVVREPATGDTVHVTLCAPEPTAGPRDPARYLATALFGGHPGSRLAERCRRLRRAHHTMFAGRDLVGDRARALVRLSVPRGDLGTAVADVAAEARDLAHRPPGPAELAAVRRYCGAQLLSAFDSPAALADALRHTAAAGRGLDWVVRRPTLLAEPTAEAVRAAGEALFAGVTATAVVLGDVPETTGFKELIRDPARLATLESHS